MILKPLFFRVTKSNVDKLSMKVTVDGLINNVAEAKLETSLEEIAKVEIADIIVPLKFNGRVHPYKVPLADLIRNNIVGTEVIDIDTFIAKEGS